MDINLIGMILALLAYIVTLGLASIKKINLGVIATLCAIATLWFSYQWKQWIGILVALAGIFAGIFVLKLFISANHKTIK